jgi:hypothetical protein
MGAEAAAEVDRREQKSECEGVHSGACTCGLCVTDENTDRYVDVGVCAFTCVYARAC